MVLTSAGGVQLGLHHHHVVVKDTVEALDIVLVLVLTKLQHAVILAVEVDHGEVGVGHLNIGGKLGDKLVGHTVAEHIGAVGVGGGGQERIVTAVAEDETVVLLQHLARILARNHGALGEEGVGEGALTHVGLLPEVAVLAGDDLEGLLLKGAGGAAEEAEAYVLGYDTGAVGGQDLGMGGPLDLFVDIGVHILQIVLVAGEHDGVVEARGGSGRDIGMGDDLTHQLAVSIKAGGADGLALPLVGGELNRLLVLGGALGGNRAVGGVADGVALGGGDLHGLCRGGIEAAYLREGGVDLDRGGAVADKEVGGLGGGWGVGGCLGIGRSRAALEGHVAAVFGGLGGGIGGVCTRGVIGLVTRGQSRCSQQEERQQERGGAGREMFPCFHGGVVPFHIDFQFIIPQTVCDFGDRIENI